MTDTTRQDGGRAARFGEILKVAEFRVLFTSFALLVLGDTVKSLAFSVLIYQRTGSPGLSAAAYMIGFLPQVIGATFLLSITDRVRPRPLMLVGEAIRIGVCLALALGDLSIWAMLLVVLVTGVPTPVFSAARNAILPDLLEGDAFVVGRALFTVSAASAQVVGLALGGTVLAVVGPQKALLITAVLSLGSALFIRFGLADRPARAAQGAGRDTVRTTLRVNRMLLADRHVRVLMLAMWLPLLCMVGAEAVFVPYLTGLGSPSAAGAVLAATAVGMGVGEFLVGRFVLPETRERLVVPLMAALGVPLLGFAFHPGVVASAVLAALASACMSYTLGLQRPFVDAVPADVRGQAFGLQNAGTMTGQGLGAGLVGAVAEWAPPHQAIALSGLAAIIVAFALSRMLTRARPA
ncbi:MFS transporter [Sphaerisporangium fuscum]|uniref:MFS transporter n=1 Tax=Sphaerisporangium fuscum TaxID=2835868 RepID=UPI001BDCE21D|nr:MFS transporter [Sphaerisporangium fuscum]